MKSFVTYYFVKAILNFFSFFPLPFNHGIGKFIGLCLYAFNSRARQISEINIRTCMPELSLDQQQKLVKNSLLELGKTISELGPVWLWKTDKIFAHLQVEGKEIVQSAINENKGVILITPHIGCWEMAGLYVGKQWSCLNLYHPPKIISLEHFILHARGRTGAKIVATQKKGLAILLKSLRSGHVTGILPDQTPKDRNSGTFAPFFGRPALTINLVSSLVKKTGAEVFMCYVKRLPEGQGYILRFQKTQTGIDSPDNLTSATALNQSVEQLIKQAPEQYLWSYKRFKQVAEGLQEIY